MSGRTFVERLISLDHWAWLFFIGWFGVSLGLHLAGLDESGRLSFWGIVLLLICYHVRLLFVAEQFRLERRPTYRLLAYLLLGILVLSVVIQIVR